MKISFGRRFMLSRHCHDFGITKNQLLSTMIVASQHWKTIAFLYSRVTSAIVSWLQSSMPGQQTQSQMLRSASVLPPYSLRLSHLLTANCELIALAEGTVFPSDKVDIKQDEVLFELWGSNFSSSIWKFCIKNVWNSSVCPFSGKSL